MEVIKAKLVKAADPISDFYLIWKDKYYYPTFLTYKTDHYYYQYSLNAKCARRKDLNSGSNSPWSHYFDCEIEEI